MLTNQMLEQLAEQHDAPCVSIYSPTHDSSAEAEGDPIWLKTGLQDAEKMLAEQDVPKTTIDSILQPARDFQAQLTPNDYGAGTLCAFLADGFEELLFTPTQVPEGQTFVSDRFHLKPLIPVLTDNATFYVLAISRHDVRLLKCTRYTQAEEPLSRSEVPKHILEAIPDVEPKKSIQQHSGNVRGEGQGQHEAMYHGQGKEQRVEAHQVFHYFREVNEGIVKYMDGRSPLVFAGVGELFDPYRKANTYDYLLDTPVTGNPEHLRPDELREKAWEVLEPYFHQRVAEAQANFEQARAYGRATDDMKAIVLAARDGRVGAFFGATDCEYWGRVPETGEDVQMSAERKPGDYDLIDYAAVKTMLQSGHAYLLEADQVPGEGKGAAVILRY
ncbi:MAG: hypothetical protein GF393_04300 [Armatimonadia bacterium]|nr:hypothetical protein [Armatimonadia bacterium]